MKNGLTSGYLSAQNISSDYSLRFSNNAGFNMTSSGETFFSPVKSGIFLSKSSSARSKGEAPFKLSRAVELMWLAIRLMSF